MNKKVTYRPTQNYYFAPGQKLMTEVSTDPAQGGSIVAEKTRIPFAKAVHAPAARFVGVFLGLPQRAEQVSISHYLINIKNKTKPHKSINPRL